MIYNYNIKEIEELNLANTANTTSEFDIIKSEVESKLRNSQKIRDKELIPADSTK